MRKTSDPSVALVLSNVARLGDEAPGVVWDRCSGLGFKDVVDAGWVRVVWVGVEGNNENKEGDLTCEGDVARL